MPGWAGPGRGAPRGGRGGPRLAWRPAFAPALAGATAACIALAVYIAHQAVEAEQKIVRATRIALSISASRDPNNPKWQPTKAEMLRLIREGVTINRHYRKITPMVADELARWGDWKEATWVWESVLSSRPHVVAIMSNVARGYTMTGNPAKALEYLERAKKIQPSAPAVRSLEVILLTRTGQDARALELARAAIHDNIYDYDLTNAAFFLASRAGDYALAEQAMRLRMVGWPDTRVQGYMQLGQMHANGTRDMDKALVAFKQALELAPEAQRPALLPEIPSALREKLTQISASKG